MTVFTVTDPVFKTEPLFVIGCTHGELVTYLRTRFRVEAPENTEIAGQMLTFARVPWRVVWCRRPDVAVVCHELFHLVTRICQDKGIPIRAHNAEGENADETAAYLYEFFARPVLRRVLRANARGR